MKRKVEDHTEDAARKKIESRYEERLGLYVHTAAYIGMNLVFWLMFVTAGAGFPWPLFVTAGWGIGFAAHAMHYHYNYGAGAEKKEAEIEAEIERQYRLARMQEDSWSGEPLAEDRDEEARIYDLSGVEPSNLRLTDDGELVDFDEMDERDLARRGRS